MGASCVMRSGTIADRIGVLGVGLAPLLRITNQGCDEHRKSMADLAETPSVPPSALYNEGLRAPLTTTSGSAPKARVHSTEWAKVRLRGSVRRAGLGQSRVGAAFDLWLNARR